MKHVITVLCLVLSVVFYLAGSETGAVGLVGVGALAETILWFRLFRRNRT